MAKPNAPKPPAKPNTKTARNPISKNHSKPAGKSPSNTGSRPVAGANKPKTARRKPTTSSSSGSTKINHYEQQRLDRIREKDERKAIKEEKQLLRKKERIAKLKILTKKNRKGQPIMGGRMELLLQKIQKGCL